MVGMRTPLVLVVVLALLGVGAYFTLLRDDDTAPPPPAPVTASTMPSAGSVGSEQGSVRSPVATTPPEGTTTPRSPSTNPSPAAPSPAATPPNVVLVVRDLAARGMVPAFRWQFRNSLAAQRGEGVAGRAELSLEPSAVGQLLVEADGLAPFVRDGLIVPTAPASAVTVDVFLAPAVAAAGITLHVRDVASKPVEHVRVDAFALAAEGAATTWQLGSSLWARRASDRDGRYVLPTLAAGEYGIRIVATDKDGSLLPFLPFLRTYTLTGDNGFVEDVPLEVGALLTIDLVDNAGLPYDPSRFGTATLSLRIPGGPSVQRKWIVRGELAEAIAIDVVPGLGKLQLAEAVTPGPWQFEVFVNGEPRVQRSLFLRAGMTNEERVQVP